MRSKSIHLTLLIAAIVVLGCNSQKNNSKSSLAGTKKRHNELIVQGKKALARIIIYKTKNDYTKFVPVIMNAKKTKIIAYPSPFDVYYKGKLAYPTKLKNGYLLDNRGITKNVAFLSITYEEYVKLDHVDIAFLQKKILDKNPLTFIAICNSRRVTETLSEYNHLINSGFKNCTCYELEEPSAFLE